MTTRPLSETAPSNVRGRRLLWLVPLWFALVLVTIVLPFGAPWPHAPLLARTAFRVAVPSSIAVVLFAALASEPGPMGPGARAIVLTGLIVSGVCTVTSLILSLPPLPVPRCFVALSLLGPHCN